MKPNIDPTFLKLSKEINFDILPSMEKTKVISVQSLDGEKVEIGISLFEFLPFEDFKFFLEKINEFNRIKFIPYFQIENLTLTTEIIRKYFNYAFRQLQEEGRDNYFDSKRIEINGMSINFYFKSESELQEFLNIHKNDFLNKISKWGFQNIEIHFEIDKEFMKNIQMMQKAYLASLEKSAQVNKELKNNNYVSSTQSNTNSSKKSFYHNKNNSYTLMSMSEVWKTEEKYIQVAGEIFKIEENLTKNNILISTISITDYHEAVKLKIFSKSDGEKAEVASYKVGDSIMVSGDFTYDEFTKSKMLNPKIIEKISVFKDDLKDEAIEKRVELAARSYMNAMDGIASPKDYIKAAEKMGHKAIAIVDLDSVQSFPEFYAAASNSKVKAIYGASFSTIESKNNVVLNLIPQKLKNAKYLVFDLETTGLSPRFNEIIEFGAVVVENGEIKDRIQFFLKPNEKIPAHITELTNITNEMVQKEGYEQLEGLIKIRECLENSIAVAHNAQFDISFVNQKLEEYNLEPLNISTIDSLVVARMLNPDSKKFRLENLATRLGINYDSTIAHRADYDADVLARIWINFLQTFAELNIKTTDELENYQVPELNSKKFSNEITIIAKNQAGLKELFKTISSASTETSFNGPKLFFDKIKKSDNLFLSSSTLNSRLIDKLIYSTKAKLYEEISHYDYIEIPAPRNFVHLIRRNIITQKDLYSSLKDLILEAKRQNKIVVAVSNCRYVYEREKIFHEIYINAKGLGGVRHYLFKYGEKEPVYPTQNLLSTNEMLKEFEFLEDEKLIKEIVIDNTNLIADQIEEVEVIKKKLYPPKFDNSKENLASLVYKTAKEIYGDELPEIVSKRIERELQPILKYGFDVVYWISHKLVAKSLQDGYLVGSRGSVGSSLVATMAGITEVNPLVPHYVCSKCKKSEFFENSKYQSGFDLPDKNCDNCNIPFDKDGQTIPFETFLGFEADKVPDIDLNFSGDYQPQIHDETKKLFGEYHTFRAGTISTNAEKTVYGYVRTLSEDSDLNFSSAFMDFLSVKGSGVKRTTGQHPGGIIVIPKEYDVEDFTPINFPANNDSSTWKTTHFDFHAIHDNVLKLDLLGHDDPTAIKMLEELTGVEARSIKKSDPKIISLFSSPEALGISPEDISGETTGAMGIPEFGTNFVRGMLKSAKVTSFADLVAISGLSHGTDVWKGNAEDLILQKGLSFQEVVSCRDDIMVYLINKGIEPALSFKIMESVRKGKSITPEWEEILLKNNIPDWYISSLKKIKYMFPKAHATAYVLMAWRIAYYKLYHPLAYYATYFSTRADVSDIETLTSGKNVINEKLRDFKKREFFRGQDALSAKEKDLIPIFEIAEEMYARGYTISNINLQKSKAKDWILDEENKTLIPPFSSLDGLGIAVANSIVKAREEKWFTSIEDFKERTSINKTLVEKLRKINVLKDLTETSQMTLF